MPGAAAAEPPADRAGGGGEVRTGCYKTAAGRQPYLLQHAAGSDVESSDVIAQYPVALSHAADASQAILGVPDSSRGCARPAQMGV
jgi:hypothetical protein